MFDTVNNTGLVTLSFVYIAAPSESGAQLFYQIKDAVEQIKPDGWQIEWLCVNHPDYPEYHLETLSARQSLALYACLTADLVIFDGSIDSEEGTLEIILNDCVERNISGKCVCSQYEYAYELMKSLDFVLIVSRTQIPYNFEGLRKGGAPGWIKVQSVQQNKPLPLKKRSLNNDEILQWIVEVVCYSNVELPRSDKTNVVPKSVFQLNKLMLQIPEMIKRSSQRIQGEFINDIFISFLSKHSMLLMEDKSLSMESLIHRYAADLLEGKGSFIYYPPGNISDEVMSERRRWEIVSMIDRQMEQCKGVLIFQSDDYDHSWWTTAEKVCLSYRLYDNTEAKYQIYVFHPPKSDGDAQIEKLDSIDKIRAYLPTLDKKQHREIARRFSNSDPFEASYEFDEIASSMHKLPKPLKMFGAGLSAIELWILQRTEFGQSQFGEKNDSFIDLYRGASSSIASFTWTEDFNKSLVCECKTCRDEYFKTHPEESTISVQRFIENNSYFTHRLSIEECDAIHRFFDSNPVGKKDLKLECGHKITIRRNGHYYRFLQPRGGKVVNRDNQLVKVIPIYTLDS